jgi:hypothetical protein
MLGRQGHAVSSLPEGRGRGRVADLEVCDTLVEVKSWLRLPDRHGRPPTDRSVLNKLLDAGGQAPAVVLNGCGSGLSMRTACRGMALYISRPGQGLLSTVRVVGDGFDLGWTCRAEMGLATRSPSRLQRTRREAERPERSQGLGR